MFRSLKSHSGFPASGARGDNEYFPRVNRTREDVDRADSYPYLYKSPGASLHDPGIQFISPLRKDGGEALIYRFGT